MVYELIGDNRKLKKSEKRICCEICNTTKIVKKNKFTCSTKCSTLRSKIKINFCQNARGMDWSAYLTDRLNKTNSYTQ